LIKFKAAIVNIAAFTFLNDFLLLFNKPTVLNKQKIKENFGTKFDVVIKTINSLKKSGRWLS